MPPCSCTSSIQLVENNFLVPKIQSDAIDLHPSAVIMALVIGGAIFGLLGAILALPVTAAFRDVFKYIFRRAGELGGAQPGDPAVHGRGGRGDGGGGRPVLRPRWARTPSNDPIGVGAMTRPLDPGWDPYRVLQVDPEADDEIVQVVYRRLARMYHPDVTPGPEAAARMLEINAAMEILGDPIRREAYDRERAARAAVRVPRRTRWRIRVAGPVRRPPPGGRRPPPASPGRPTGAPGAGCRGEHGPAACRDRRRSRATGRAGRSTEGGGYDPDPDAHGQTGRERPGRRRATRRGRS